MLNFSSVKILQSCQFYADLVVEAGLRIRIRVLWSDPIVDLSCVGWIFNLIKKNYNYIDIIIVKAKLRTIFQVISCQTRIHVYSKVESESGQYQPGSATND